MSFTTGDMLKAIGPSQCQSITAAALATILSGLVTPAAHAAQHKSAGSDPIRLDELKAPTDVTTLNVSTSAHGLCPKGTNTSTAWLRDDASWSVISASAITTGTLPAAQFPAFTNHALLVGTGATGSPGTLAPSTSGNVAMSDGTDWVSTTPTWLKQPQVMARICRGA